MVSWPNMIPGFSLDWKRGYKDNVYRSQPERGPSKTRLKNTNTEEELSGTLNLTYEAFKTFINWYEDELKFGALVFSFNDFIKGSCRARIVEVNYKNTGSDMQVSLKLEIFK